MHLVGHIVPYNHVVLMNPFCFYSYKCCRLDFLCDIWQIDRGGSCAANLIIRIGINFSGKISIFDMNFIKKHEFSSLFNILSTKTLITFSPETLFSM